MRPAPVRRVTAAGGLLALIPVAVMLITDNLTPAEAAVRALAILGAVLLVTWGVGAALRFMAGSLEYDARRRERERLRMQKPESSQGGGHGAD